MRGLVIVNANAGTSDRFAGIEQRLTSSGFVIHRSEGPGDALQAASRAAQDGLDLVVAAGGDGTVTQVAEGLARAGGRVPLGVLPMGTGNDLARTLAIPADSDAAFDVLLQGRERQIDVIRVEADAGPSVYAVNLAAGGFSGHVGQEITPEAKEMWGPLAYVFGAAKALPNLGGYKTTIAWDGEESQEVDALNIVVANCRFCAAGKLVAPLANPEDGWLDVVLVHRNSMLDLAGVVARLALGNYLESDAVDFRRARSLRIESDPPMRFNVDGEPIPEGPVTFRLLPGALRVLVGADYCPELSAA